MFFFFFFFFLLLLWLMTGRIGRGAALVSLVHPPTIPSEKSFRRNSRGKFPHLPNHQTLRGHLRREEAGLGWRRRSTGACVCILPFAWGKTHLWKEGSTFRLSKNWVKETHKRSNASYRYRLSPDPPLLGTQTNGNDLPRKFGQPHEAPQALPMTS
jgi:hypothetical protein